MLIENHSARYDDGISLQVYPNPTTGLLFIECDQQITTIRVFDMYGKVVQQQPVVNLNTLNLDINSLANGMYVIEIKGDTYTKIQRIIKQ
jgi:hypothetical protein